MTVDRIEPGTERAPLLLVFGDLGRRAAALLRVRPSLIPRLILAPREAVHAIGAFLHLAPNALQSDAEVAALIEDSDPRDLLRNALPGCPAALYRALDRAGDRVHGRAFYQRLHAAASGPFGDALLQNGNLNESRLCYFEALSQMDPFIASLRRALPESRHTAEAVDSVLAYLRAQNALVDGDLNLPAKSGLPAVLRRLRRSLGRITAPHPGFDPPATYRLVETSDELQRIGRAFENCVAMPQWQAVDHHFRLLRGDAAYLTSEVPPVLIELRRAGPGVWILVQVAGPKNAPAPDGAEAALRRGLTDAGLRLVEIDPALAIFRLDSEARSGRTGEADDLDDGLDDLGEVAA